MYVVVPVSFYSAFVMTSLFLLELLRLRLLLACSLLYYFRLFVSTVSPCMPLCSCLLPCFLAVCYFFKLCGRPVSLKKLNRPNNCCCCCVCPKTPTSETVVIAKAFTPAAKVQEEIQVTLVNGLRASAGELGEPLNAAIEKLPADLKQGLLQRLNGQ